MEGFQMRRECSRCKETKNIQEFREYRVKDKFYRRWICNACMDQAAIRWVLENEERKRQYDKEYYHKNREANINRVREWNEANKERSKVNAKRSYWRLKEAAYMAYGGYKCQCCGETEPLFLSIDHVNNDGHLYRKAKKTETGTWIKVGSHCGENLFRWLRRENYPEGFQVLCLNCNGGKHRNGGVCPHQVKKA